MPVLVLLGPKQDWLGLSSVGPIVFMQRNLIIYKYQIQQTLDFLDYLGGASVWEPQQSGNLKPESPSVPHTGLAITTIHFLPQDFYHTLHCTLKQHI